MPPPKSSSSLSSNKETARSNAESGSPRNKNASCSLDKIGSMELQTDHRDQITIKTPKQIVRFELLILEKVSMTLMIP